MAPKQDLAGALKALKEFNSPDDYWSGLETLKQLLENIQDNPDDERYRNFSSQSPDFYGRIGFLIGSERLMAAAGFKSKKNGQQYSMSASQESWNYLAQVCLTLNKALQDKQQSSSSSSSSSKKKKKSNNKEKSSSSKSSKVKDSPMKEKSSSSIFGGTSKKPLDTDQVPSSITGSLRAAAKRPMSKNGKDLYDSGLEPPSTSEKGEEGQTRQPTSGPRGKKISSEASPNHRRRGSTDSTASSISEESSFDNEGELSSRGNSPVQSDQKRGKSVTSNGSSTNTGKKSLKNAATQALFVAKMREGGKKISPKRKPKSEVGAMEGTSKKKSLNFNQYDDDLLEDDDSDAPPSIAKSRWLSAKGKIDAVNAFKNSGKESGGSKRSLMSKSDSARSMDSSKSGTRRPGLSRSSSKTLTESNRQLSKSERKLMREQSRKERREKKKMEKEANGIRQWRRKILEKRIKEEGGPRWTFLFQVVTLLTLAELGLDLGTTIISFISLIESFDCCGQVIEVGTLTLGVTVPYVVLIVIEFLLLACSVRQARQNTFRDQERMKKIDNLDEEWFDDEGSWGSLEDEKKRFNFGSVIHWVLLANPFLGALITWILLYEVSSRKDAFVIMGFECGSILLMFVGVWIQREKMTCGLLCFNAIPLIPFAGICFVVWYYLQRGGICFRDGNFWFDNCGLCAPNEPAPDSGECLDGSTPYQGTYCGEIIAEQFCYFAY